MLASLRSKRMDDCHSVGRRGARCRDCKTRVRIELSGRTRPRGDPRHIGWSDGGRARVLRGARGAGGRIGRSEVRRNLLRRWEEHRLGRQYSDSVWEEQGH